MSVTSASLTARAIRNRLWNPANAKPDHGINMKNGRTAEDPKETVSAIVIVPPVDQTRQKSRGATPSRRADRGGNPMAVPMACKWTTLLGCEPQIPIPEHYVTTRHVIAAVAKVWDIQPSILTGPRREWFALTPRHAAIAISYEVTKLSNVEIGKVFGGRDHATVLNARARMSIHIDAVRKQMEDLPEWVVAPEMSIANLPLEWARAMKARLG